MLLFLSAEDVAPVDNPGKAVIDGVGHRIRGMEARERHIQRVFTKTHVSSQKTVRQLDRYAVVTTNLSTVMGLGCGHHVRAGRDCPGWRRWTGT